jgi:hypothetical protein
MNAYLVRVGIDITEESGHFNAPVDLETMEFAYVPIKESKEMLLECKRTFVEFISPCEKLGVELPSPLLNMHAHIDPDFSKLTYGDIDGKDPNTGKLNRRGRPLRKLQENDILVFYAGLKPIKYLSNDQDKLTYAIIGLYVIKERPISAHEFVRRGLRDDNAHTRCQYSEADIIIVAKPKQSGRLEKCIPIGKYCNKAYRVTKKLLDEWGGLYVNDGYIQRSARLPKFKDPERFYKWFNEQLRDRQTNLVQRNN